MLVFCTCQIILVLFSHMSHQQVGAHLPLAVGPYCQKKSNINKNIFKQNKQTLWPESASELYRPSDRRVLAKSVPTLRIEGVVWTVQRIPMATFSIF
jgi:hypothetical protein